MDAESFLRSVFEECNSSGSGYVRPSLLIEKLRVLMSFGEVDREVFNEKLKNLKCSLDPTIRDDGPITFDHWVDKSVPWMQNVIDELVERSNGSNSTTTHYKGNGEEESISSHTLPTLHSDRSAEAAVKEGNEEVTNGQMVRSLSESKKLNSELIEQLDQYEERIDELESEVKGYKKECSGLKRKIRGLEEELESKSSGSTSLESPHVNFSFNAGGSSNDDNEEGGANECISSTVKRLRAENNRLSDLVEEKQSELQEFEQELATCRRSLSELHKSNEEKKSCEDELTELRMALEISKEKLIKKENTITSLRNDLEERNTEFERICQEGNESRRASMIQAFDLLNSSGTFADSHLLTHLSSVERSDADLMTSRSSIGNELAKFDGLSPILDIHTKEDVETQTGFFTCPNCEDAGDHTQENKHVRKEGRKTHLGFSTENGLSKKRKATDNLQSAEKGLGERNKNCRGHSCSLFWKGLKAFLLITLMFTLVGGLRIDEFPYDFYPLPWSPALPLPEPLFLISVSHEGHDYW